MMSNGAIGAAASTDKIHISISDVMNLLKEGVTRCQGDKGYDPEKGSIQEKYGLNKSQVGRLFKHPKLKGLKVNIPREEVFQIVDDTEIEASESTTRGAYSFTENIPVQPEAAYDITELTRPSEPADSVSTTDSAFEVSSHTPESVEEEINSSSDY
jgi:hypothetical protein